MSEEKPIRYQKPRRLRAISLSLSIMRCIRTIDDAETFWAEQANEFLTVFETWDQVSSSDFTTATATWFRGAKLNATITVLTDTWKNVATKPQ